MAGISISPVHYSGVELKAEGTHVKFSGFINHPRPGEYLAPFIDAVHNAIIEEKIKEVVVDLTDLRFLNSSGIREFVDWILRLNNLEDEEKYTIKFLCSNEHKWQDLSMTTITFLNPSHTSVSMV
jgi:hypothetical protein